MAGLQMEGIADSGYGVTLGGFHCPAVEFPSRLEDLKSRFGPFRDVCVREENGYVTFLAYARETPVIPQGIEIQTFRREPHKFFVDLPRFLLKTRAQFVDRMVLSGSMGSLSLTLLYRPVESAGA